MARELCSSTLPALSILFALTTVLGIGSYIPPTYAGNKRTPTKKDLTRILKKFERANLRKKRRQAARLLCETTSELQGFVEKDGSPLEWPTGQAGWPRKWLDSFVGSAELRDASVLDTPSSTPMWQLRSAELYVNFGAGKKGNSRPYCIRGYDLSKGSKPPRNRMIEVLLTGTNRLVRLPPGVEFAPVSSTRDKIFADDLVIAVSNVPKPITADEGAEAAKNEGARITKVEQLSDGWFIAFVQKRNRRVRRGVMQRGTESDSVACDMVAQSSKAFRKAVGICRSLRTPPPASPRTPGRPTASSLRPARFDYPPTTCGRSNSDEPSEACGLATLTRDGTIFFVEEGFLRRVRLESQRFAPPETVIASLSHYAASDTWIAYSTEDGVQVRRAGTQEDRLLEDACRRFLDVYRNRVATGCGHQVRVFELRGGTWHRTHTLNMPRRGDLPAGPPSELRAMRFAGPQIVVGLPRPATDPHRSRVPGRLVVFDQNGEPSELPPPPGWAAQFKPMARREKSTETVAPAPFGSQLAVDASVVAIPGTTSIFIARLGESARRFVEVPLPFPLVAISSSVVAHDGLVAIATRSAYVQNRREEETDGPIEEYIFVIDGRVSDPSIIARIPRNVAATSPAAAGDPHAPVLQPGPRPSSSARFGHRLVFRGGRLGIIDDGLTLPQGRAGGAFWMLDASRAALSAFAPQDGPSVRTPPESLPFGPAAPLRIGGPYRWSQGTELPPKRRGWYREILSLTIPDLTPGGPVTVIGQVKTDRRRSNERFVSLGTLEAGGTWTPTRRRLRPARAPKSRRPYVAVDHGIVAPNGRQYGSAALISARKRSRGHPRRGSKNYLVDCPVGLGRRLSLKRLKADCAVHEVHFQGMRSPIHHRDQLAFISTGREGPVLVLVRLQPRFEVVTIRTIDGHNPSILANPLTGRALLTRNRRGELLVQPLDLNRPETSYPWLALGSVDRIAVRPDGRPLARVAANDNLQFVTFDPQGLIREIKMPDRTSCNNLDPRFYRWEGGSLMGGMGDEISTRNHGWEGLVLPDKSGRSWCVMSAATLSWSTVPAPPPDAVVKFDGRGQPFVLVPDRTTAALLVYSVKEGTRWPIGHLTLPEGHQIEATDLSVSAAGDRIVVAARTRGRNSTSRWRLWLAHAPIASAPLSSLDIKVD